MPSRSPCRMPSRAPSLPGWVGTERAMRQGKPLPANPAMVVVLVAVAVTAVVLGVTSVTGA